MAKIQEDSIEEVAYATVVVEDIMRMKRVFVNCHFSFIRRIDNVVSQTLTKFALNCCFDIHWKDYFPSRLKSITTNDMMEQLL